jgi:lactoylglutathione lyase
MKKDLFPILYARDLPRSIRFYRDLIGMTESYRFPTEGEPSFVTLAWGTGSLGLGTYDVTPGLEARDLRPPVAGRGFEICIYVPDVDALVARLKGDGLEALVEPMDQPWGERLAYVTDPEGNTVMLAAEIQRSGEPIGQASA